MTCYDAPTSRILTDILSASRGPPSRSVLPSTPCGKSARPTGQDIAVASSVSNAGLPLDNKLLASLPRDHFDRLLPHLTTVVLRQGDVLFEAGDEVDQIYFPNSECCCSAAARRQGSKPRPSDVKAWSRDGGTGLVQMLVRVVVQLSTGASKIAATHFRTVAAGSELRPQSRIRYNGAAVAGARHACNALHLIGSRSPLLALRTPRRARATTN